MKVKELARAIAVCGADDDLRSAARVMQRDETDVVPLVDAQKTIRGVITLRAVCEAIAASADRKPSTIKLGKIALEEILLCEPQEKFAKVLKKLIKNRIKYAAYASRQNAERVAIISLPEIVAHFGADQKTIKKVFRALEKISRPQPLVLTEIDVENQNKQSD